MRGSRVWTPHEDDELWRLHCEGVTTIRLSVRFKRTYRAIEARLMVLRKRARLRGDTGEIGAPGP